MRVPSRRPLLAAALLLAAPACRSGPEPAAPAATTAQAYDPSARASIVERVDLATARRLAGEGAALIDVSPPADFERGHVEGARNIPLEELAARLSEIPKQRPVIVSASETQPAARAARLLAEAGYEVRDLGAAGAPHD